MKGKFRKLTRIIFTACCALAIVLSAANVLTAQARGSGGYTAPKSGYHSGNFSTPKSGGGSNGKSFFSGSGSTWSGSSGSHSFFFFLPFFSHSYGGWGYSPFRSVRNAIILILIIVIAVYYFRRRRRR